MAKKVGLTEGSLMGCTRRTPFIGGNLAACQSTAPFLFSHSNIFKVLFRCSRRALHPAPEQQTVSTYITGTPCTQSSCTPCTYSTSTPHFPQSKTEKGQKCFYLVRKKSERVVQWHMARVSSSYWRKTHFLLTLYTVGRYDCLGGQDQLGDRYHRSCRTRQLHIPIHISNINIQTRTSPLIGTNDNCRTNAPRNQRSEMFQKFKIGQY